MSARPLDFECPRCHSLAGVACAECAPTSAQLREVAPHAERATEPMPAARERAVSAPLAPLPAQLDLDGGAHELAPQTRQERLFAPALAQLEGQTFLSDAELER